jgi:hypothetical protein
MHETNTIGNADTAPDGTTTAVKLVESTGAPTHYTYGVIYSDATNKTHSVFLKAGNRTKVRLFIGVSAVGDGAGADFDLSAGTAGAYFNFSPGSYTPTGDPTIKAYPDGWYRCSISVTTPASPHVGYVQPLGNDGSPIFTGDPTQPSCYVWGPQMEVGPAPTSLIPTLGASVTRAADLLRVETSAYPHSATAGTLIIAAILRSARSGHLLNLSDNTSDERFAVYEDIGSVQFYIGDGGVMQANVVAGGFTAGTPLKAGFAWAANDIAAVKNGGTVNTDASASLPTVSRLRIGNSESDTQPVHALISQITYVPRRMTNAELQAATS